MTGLDALGWAIAAYVVALLIATPFLIAWIIRERRRAYRDDLARKRDTNASTRGQVRRPPADTL